MEVIYSKIYKRYLLFDLNLTVQKTFKYKLNKLVILQKEYSLHTGIWFHLL